MRNTKLVASIVSLLTVMILIFVAGVTAFATEAPLTTEPVPTYIEETQVVEEETQPSVEETQEQTEEIYEEPQEEESQEEQYVEETEAPTHYEVYGDDLPQVSQTEIVEPTKMAIPEVEVSDTSLIGGVIAWLCVAVGIAVIAGMLVSQRTRQVGSSSTDNRRR